MRNKYYIKAFTVFELLISMTLSGILVAFAFMGFNQLQHLFTDYTKQSTFIAEINQLNSAFFNLSENADFIEKQNDKTLVFKTDSTNVSLILQETNILLKFKSHTDTFHFETQKTEIKTLNLTAETPSNLVLQFDTDVFFRNQKFHVSFHKYYDAEHILKTTTELFPPDELH